MMEKRLAISFQLSAVWSLIKALVYSFGIMLLDINIWLCDMALGWIDGGE
jgi:hypothetical protein